MKEKMKKNILFLVVIAVVCVFTLCACGEKDLPKVETKVIDNSVENNPTNVDVTENEIIEPVEEVNDTEETFEEEEEQVVSQETLDKLVIGYNGNTFRIGEKFEEVKERLGDEASPAQSYTPCGGSDDAQVTSHQYDGLVVEETAEGLISRAVISGFDFPESKATVAGVSLGASPDEVKGVFAEKPDTDSEYTINYMFNTYILSFGLDTEGTGTVNYISIDDYLLGGI